MTATVRLGDICEMRSGGTPRRGVDGYYGGKIPWVTIADMSASPDGVVCETAERITESGLSAIGNRLFQEGTILLAMYGSVGKLAVAGCPLATNQAILGLQPRDPRVLESRYLKSWLGSIQSKLVFDARGVTQANISKGIVEGLRIPLPALREQSRIADVLDKADAIRRRRKEATALTEELLRSAFLEMFGDPVTNPKGWTTRPLGQLLSFLTSGSRGWAEYYSDVGDMFLRIQNVKDDRLDLTDVAYVHAPDSAEARRTRTLPGDVLLSITADLGRTAVVPESAAQAFINQHLAILRPNNVNPEYLSAFLASEGGQRQVRRLNKGGVKAGLNFDDIRSLDIVLPPDDLQHAFADRKAHVRRLAARYAAAWSNSALLFDSLVARAFPAGPAKAGGAC